MKQTSHNKQAGFTLVELAIVLVIIGLIVGGVLAGQDLIKAAQIRNAQGEVEQLNTAATTFQLKFNGLPGDLAQATAVASNMTAISTGTVNTGLRDGNGSIEGAGVTNSMSGEPMAFFSDLSIAGLLGGAPNTYGTITAVANAGVAVTAANAGTYFPTTKLRNNANIGVLSLAGRNTIFIGTPVAGASTAVALGNAVTPTEAAQFESKFDDGNPLTGTVRVPNATITGVTTVPAAVATTTCLTTTATGAYNTGTTGTGAGNNPVCALAITASF